MVSSSGYFNQYVSIHQNHHSFSSLSQRLSRRKDRTYSVASGRSVRFFATPIHASIAFLRLSHLFRYCSRTAERTSSEIVVPSRFARLRKATHTSSSRYSCVLCMMYMIHRVQYQINKKGTVHILHAVSYEICVYSGRGRL